MLLEQLSRTCNELAESRQGIVAEVDRSIDRLEEALRRLALQSSEGVADVKAFALELSENKELLDQQASEQVSKMEALKQSDSECHQQLDFLARALADLSEARRGSFAEVESCQSSDRKLEADLQRTENKLERSEGQIPDRLTGERHSASEAADFTHNEASVPVEEVFEGQAQDISRWQNELGELQSGSGRCGDLANYHVVEKNSFLDLVEEASPLRRVQSCPAIFANQVEPQWLVMQSSRWADEEVESESGSSNADDDESRSSSASEGDGDDGSEERIIEVPQTEVAETPDEEPREKGGEKGKGGKGKGRGKGGKGKGRGKGSKGKDGGKFGKDGKGYGGGGGGYQMRSPGYGKDGKDGGKSKGKGKYDRDHGAKGGGKFGKDGKGFGKKAQKWW
eukprot:symbB.v1.2.037501.t1/scaffold5557.1/size51549/2